MIKHLTMYVVDVSLNLIGTEQQALGGALDT